MSISCSTFLLKLQFVATTSLGLSKTFHVADLVAAVFGDSVGTVLQVRWKLFEDSPTSNANPSQHSIRKGYVAIFVALAGPTAPSPHLQRQWNALERVV